MVLIKYLPVFVQDFAEIRQIMNAEQGSIDATWTGENQVQKEQYISTASVYTIERWESMLSISPKATETLEDRRFRILTRLQSDTPYTMLKLNEKLSNLCGADGYHITLTASSYAIDIKLALGNKSMMDDVEKILKEMIPANMVQTISILYNTHTTLSAFTHATLSSYTHYQLKNEVVD